MGRRQGPQSSRLCVDTWTCQSPGQTSRRSKAHHPLEAPLKLAAGVVLDSQKDSTIRALVLEQFGAMLSCGAEQMVHILRTLSSLHPPDSMVFASTDVKKCIWERIPHLGNQQCVQASSCLCSHHTPSLGLMPHYSSHAYWAHGLRVL